MNIIGLLFFLAVLYFLIRFTITLLSHLFQVFGWLGTDITNLVAKALDVKTAAPIRRERQTVPRKRKTFPHKEPDKEDEEEPEEEDEELAKIVPRRKALHVETEGTPQAEIPEPLEEEELTLLVLLFYALVFAFSWLTNTFLSIMLLREPARKALKMPFPTRCTVWYFEIFLCVLPLVIFSRVPDIYGYRPTINAVYWGLFSYPCFIFLIYALRIFIPVDMETVFQVERPHTAPPGVVRYRHIIYGVTVLAVSLVLLYKLAWLGLILMCFMYSALYFFAFRKSGDPGFTFRKFVRSWILFVVFIFAGVMAVRYGVSADTMAGYAIFIIIFITMVFVHTLWVMSRKFQIGSGVHEIPLIEVGSWMNQFLVPLLKIAVAAPMFYFIILFFSIKTGMFWVLAALVAALVIFRSKQGIRLPAYVPGGLFAGYLLLVWIAIFFVQSFNRIPPSEDTCASIGGTDKLHRLYTSDEFTKVDFLDGALPYDAIMDSSNNAIFVTFKNLSGYGAVVRLDSQGNLVDRVITENDRYPGEMFYPERLCIDRERNLVFSSTKSNKNFQLLAMDYSSGLKLSERMRFESHETTNCQVDRRDGTIYVIFLGPPRNHFRIVDPDTHELKGQLNFGRFGYADYFVLDPDRERLVAPSLDPSNRFTIYEVKGLDSLDYSVVKKRIPVELTVFGGLSVGTPIPTLGVAYSSANNRLYFSCPFLRLVFEVDADSFKPLRKIKTGSFPREMAVDEKRNLLLVANYGDGDVDVFDLETMKRIDKLKVGKLVRSITVDEDSGQILIVTGCGVFEYTPQTDGG